MTAPDRPAASEDLAGVANRPLTVPLLVRGSYHNGLFVSATTGAVLFFVLACGLSTADENSYACWSFFVLSAILALPALMLGLHLRSQRRWLEVTVTGFVLSDRLGRQVHSDDQVVGIRQSSDTTAEGVLNREIVLDIVGARDEAPRRIHCSVSTPPHQEDPVSSFVDRLVNGLALRTEANLSRGAVLRGEGWVLNESGLQRGRERIELDQISYAGFFDGSLCIWRDAEVRPALRIAEESRNTQSLLAFLTRRIVRRSNSSVVPGSQSRGRLLLERYACGWIPGVVLVLLFGGLTIALLHNANSPHREAPLTGCLAVATGSITAIGVIVIWCGRSGHLRFYENGVWLSQMGRLKWLPYDQIAQVTCRRGQLTLAPPPGSDLPTIHYRTIEGPIDRHVAALRDRACEPLARRWLQSVPSNPVFWMNRLRFLPGGLEYRSANLLGLDDPVSVPYIHTRFVVKGEEFWLFADGEKMPISKHPTAGVNFFVGVVVLRWICENLKREQANADSSGEKPPAPAAANGVTTQPRSWCQTGVKE